MCGSGIRMNDLKILLLAFLLSAMIPISPASSVEPGGPDQAVETLHGEMLYVMKNAERLGFWGRYEHLAPVIKDLFDFPFMARIVVGRYWAAFSDHERALFVRTFTRLSIATYASRLDGYSGERFRMVSEEKSRQGRVWALRQARRQR